MVKATIIALFVPTILIGCASVPTIEQIRSQAINASDYDVCRALYVGIPLGKTLYPEVVYEEIKKRNLDCAPMKETLDKQLSVYLYQSEQARQQYNTQQQIYQKQQESQRRSWDRMIENSQNLIRRNQTDCHQTFNGYSCITR